MSGAPSMYERAMGADYSRLHPVVQRFHRLAGSVQLLGEVRCMPARHWLGDLLARALRAPRQTAHGPLRFELRAQPLQEHWVRHFPGSRMESTLQLRGAEVVERLGAATLHFRLREREGRLVMDLARLRFLGLSCPRWLMPLVIAEESGDEQHRFCFRVEASVPRIGLVVGYVGHLQLPQPEASWP
jgi:hypothetical protein